MSVEEQMLFGIPVCARRWGVSNDTLIRRANEQLFKTVYIGGRRLVPRSEVERIDREGLGTGRKNAAKKAV